MVGSWAGAMGHTQWMPEVWLHVGIDYNGDGKISPFGAPDDALGSTARFFVERGNYRRGEHWGHEVRIPAKSAATLAQLCRLASARRHPRRRRALSAAQCHGTAVDPRSGRSGVPPRPKFLCRASSYNPSMSYALALVALGDRCVGGRPVRAKVPRQRAGSDLAEVQEIQRRLTALGFDTGGADGRIGIDTMLAARNFQRKIGIEPADGYAGTGLLARLRQGECVVNGVMNGVVNRLVNRLLIRLDAATNPLQPVPRKCPT